MEDWPTNSRNLRVIYSSGAGTLRATNGFLGLPSAAIDFSSLESRSMEPFVVLFLCAVAALVIHWVVSPPVRSRRPSQDPAEPNRHK